MLLGIFILYQFILEQPQQLQATVWHNSHMVGRHLGNASLLWTTKNYMLKTSLTVTFKALHWVHKTLSH